MKRQFIYLFLSVTTFLATSCSEDDPDPVSSKAEIQVFEAGKPKSGITVYMFNSKQGPNTTWHRPFYADRSVVTESDGKATFNLRETFDLEIIDTQTTLYFGVFNNEDELRGSTAITIEEGETKTATINL